jgi:hypothetical protein
MGDVGTIPFRKCRICGQYYVRWESVEYIDGRRFKVHSNFFGKGYCLPCFQKASSAIDVDPFAPILGTEGKR